MTYYVIINSLKHFDILKKLYMLNAVEKRILACFKYSNFSHYLY